MRAQLVQDECLEQRPSFRTFEGLPEGPPECADHSGVKEVELWMPDLLDPGTGLPGTNPDPDQRSDEEIEVALHGRPRDGRVARQRGDLEETRERGGPRISDSGWISSRR